MDWIFGFVLAFTCIKGCLSVNILYISQVASPSHFLWNRVLALALVERKHNVTMISHVKKQFSPVNNFTLIELEGIYENEFSHFNIEQVKDNNPIFNMKYLYDRAYQVCSYDWTTKGVQTLLNYPVDKFDLIIIDLTSTGQCFYPLVQRFKNPPVVGVTPFLLPPVLSHSFGNPLQAAYMPYFATTFTDKMSFMQRLWNCIYIYADVLYRRYVMLPEQAQLAKKHLGDNIKPFEEIERNISVLLTNSDPILTFPLDLPPNIIPVGGLHIKPANPLPQDLKKIMDEAKSGVVLFSLGTNLKVSELDANKKKAFLDVFRRLKQTIVWKYDGNDLQDVPKNVVIRNWLPQSDILGHPNTKLFITHGGGLGTQEAIYFGVPIVGIPFCIDQHANVGRMVAKKMGKVLDINSLNNESLFETIQEVLNNSVYEENIKKASKWFRDQPQTPLERAVFWVEYVVRHGGAEHLVLPARDMSFFETTNLDVLIVVIFLFIVIYHLILVLMALFKFVCRYDKLSLKQLPKGG